MTRPIDTFIPRTGRTIKETGELINIGDYLQWNQDFSSVYQTAFNDVVIASKVEVGVDVDEYLIGLSVPDGHRVIIYDRVIKVNNGSFLLEVYGGAFTGGLPLLISPLRSSSSPTILSTFNYNVTPSGTPTLLEQTIVNAATDSGSKAASGSLEQNDIFKIFEGPTSGLFKVTRLGSNPPPYDIGIQYVAVEDPFITIELTEDFGLISTTEMAIYGAG